MSSETSFEIAIIGGGIAGLTLAIALHKRKVRCTIYEQAPKFGEIGAGVSFSPNAVQAMRICDQGIYEAFERICSRNQWDSKQNVWFDFLDGTESRHQGKSGHQDALFTITNTDGQNGVHRAAYLDEMVKLLPEGISKFGKRLEDISEDFQTGKMLMKFHDGTTAEADAIIGCDGIKSRVRQIIVGENHPSARPVYTHKYAYRGLIPMEKAVEAVGEERARNACMHLGPNRHVLTFPVNQGQTLNLVAFVTNDDDWPDYKKLTRPAKREDAIKEFEGFGPNVHALLKLTKPDLDCWAIFDTGDHPVPTYSKRRICVSGDAAHATSPHHGAGAGFVIEDSAVLASLLAHSSLTSAASDLAAAFSVFDATRRERTQWLVQSSRQSGNLYEWRAEGVGSDIAKIEKEVSERNKAIWDVEVQTYCDEAVKMLEARLQSDAKGRI